VLSFGAMLDELLPAAVVTAPAELRVERLEHLRLHPADSRPADRRPNVLLDLPGVAGAGLPLDIDHVEP